MARDENENERKNRLEVINNKIIQVMIVMVMEVIRSKKIKTLQVIQSSIWDHVLKKWMKLKQFKKVS